MSGNSVRNTQCSVWAPPAPLTDDEAKYVAVIGNTGSGKSTLVSRLASDLATRGRTIGIDERTTHHPFLDRLFYDPERYSYELQLNFMLQRVLIVKRWLDAGVNVVMERSHLDDVVFIRHLRKSGLASEAEAEAYLSTWRTLLRRVRLPDAIVALEVDPGVSIARITKAEQSGSRPKEFSSDRQKLEWVTGWAEFYADVIRELSGYSALSGRIMHAGESTTYGEIQHFVLDKVLTAGVAIDIDRGAHR